MKKLTSFLNLIILKKKRKMLSLQECLVYFVLQVKFKLTTFRDTGYIYAVLQFFS